MYTETDLSLLARCPVFQRIAGRDLPDALLFLDALERTYRRQEMVFLMGDAVSRAGVLLEGSVEVSMPDEEHNGINMNHFSPGDVFGEALACLPETRSPVQMQALTPCRILYLDVRRLLESERLESGWQMTLMGNLMRSFAWKNVFLGQKVRIMRERRLRGKLRLYLQSQRPSQDGVILSGMNRGELAQFLGVNRSALSRELSALQREGVLSLEGKCIRVLDGAFFEL